MKILARHKDLNNIVFGYTIENENGQQFLERDALLSYVGMIEIENAYLTKDKDFKAKDGFHIKTIKEKCNKAVAHTNNGYYGEGMLEACKRIRKLTSENKVIINRTIEEVNIHLARVLNDCGLTTEAFIKNYLSVIQPYMISKDSNNKYKCNIGYRLGANLIIDKSCVYVECFFDNVIENTFYDKSCAVLTDDAYKSSELHYSIQLSLQIGCRKHCYETFARNYNKGAALLKYTDIINNFDKHIADESNKLVKQYSKLLNNNKSSIFDDIKEADSMYAAGVMLDELEMLIIIYNNKTDLTSRATLLDMLSYNIRNLAEIAMSEEKLYLTHNCKIKNNMYNLILSIL